jgi:ATPase subunit of ABC transporter with duplicated ATPase domains
MAPHTGKLFLDNTESKEMTGPEWRKKVGLLPSESSWWFDTVGEHFNSVEEKWFKALGFDGQVMQWEVSRLSSGERQRLALLRLICNRPKVLLLDEPTANLDSDNIMQAERFLSDYRLETESSVIWISHDIKQLKRVSSCYFILKDNQLLKI